MAPPALAAPPPEGEVQRGDPPLPGVWGCPPNPILSGWVGRVARGQASGRCKCSKRPTPLAQRRFEDRWYCRP